MSERWFEGVGLAESPFAGEVEALADAWPAETEGLPPAWPEDEEDGAGGELPFAAEAWAPAETLAEAWGEAEAWTPWAPAETLAEAWGEAEDEEGPGLGRLAADRLEWPGATADQLAFMRAVYAKHLERSKAKGDTFTADLPERQLGPIEGSHQARKDAAAAARALLEEARAALAAAGLADRVRIGIISAYRSASRQFDIWQGKGRKGKGGFPHYYAEMLRQGRLRPGDFGPEAVSAMAAELANWIAAPGYSNHQDGLAIDFGIGLVGRGLGKIGKKAWFHKWLVANAARHGFHPYHKEAWHWVYRGQAGSEALAGEVATTARPGELRVDRVPLLAGHRGRPPDLLLRWNVTSLPEVIDVVVHLHGYWYAGLRLEDNVRPYSGLDLAPVGGAAGSGRSRPTLTILPRGHDTGVKQPKGPFNRYTFPALVTRDGLPGLVRFSLERLAAQLGGATPRVGRLVLTAHSGGGAALLRILEHHDPHQVHLFDALYQDAGALAAWARRRIQRDRAELATLGEAAAGEYMATRGGALRVFYGRGTRYYSRKLRAAIAADLDRALEPWYRAEASRYSHFQIPRRYGWRVLANAAADVPDASTEPVSHRELEEPQFEEAQLYEEPRFEEQEDEDEYEAEQEDEYEAEYEAEFEEEYEAEEELEGEVEGLLTHATEEALDLLEFPGSDEEAEGGRGLVGRLLERSILIAAIASGERSEKVLTDKVFRLRYPNSKGTAIAKPQEALKLEWQEIRDHQVLPLLLSGPYVGPMHDSTAPTPPGGELRKSVPKDAQLSPLSITRRGLRAAPRSQDKTIAAIVVHNTSRGPANRSRKRGFRRPAIEYALDHYLNGDEGFPHYVVDFNGTIYATCDERLVAWHAGWVHAGGARLFRSGWKAPEWWSRVWSKLGATTPIDLLPKGSKSPNYRTIGIELLLLPDKSYTPQQYRALARLVVDIQRRNPDVHIPAAPSRGLLGHEDFAPVTGKGGRADAGGGWDPGAHRDRPFFDWQLLWSEIQAVGGGPGGGGKGAEAPELWTELEMEDRFEPEEEYEGREDAEDETEEELEELEDHLDVTATQELAEPELGEVEDFLGELLAAQDGDAPSGAVAPTFPSGETLPIVSGPVGPGQEHYDPSASGNPLLDTGAQQRDKRLSRNFTVGELARSGSTRYDTARIDPKLVRCLQALRDHVGKPVTITSGYRSYLHNVRIYEQRKQKPTDSQHSSGRAADVQVDGMSGLSLAKAALDACGDDLGLGIGRTFAHIDVRGRFAVWAYLPKGEEERQAIAAVIAHRGRRGPVAPTGPAPSPAANIYIRIAGDITAAFESGGDIGKLNLYDKGVISYGRHQATLAGGNLHLVVARFVELSGGQVAQALRAYLDQLQRKDRSLKHDGQFITLLREAAKLPEMRRAQDEIFQRQYWERAAKRARDAGITSALGYALLYDSQVQGPLASKLRFKRVKDQLGGIVGAVGRGGQPISELAFLRAWVEDRKASGLRNSERNLSEAAELDGKAARLEDQASRTDPESARRLRGEAAKLREQATENRKNAASLRISVTKTRGPTWQALVDSGDLDLRGDKRGQVRLAGKQGVVVTGLKPGATIE